MIKEDLEAQNTSLFQGGPSRQGKRGVGFSEPCSHVMRRDTLGTCRRPGNIWCEHRPYVVAAEYPEKRAGTIFLEGNSVVRIEIRSENYRSGGSEECRKIICIGESPCRLQAHPIFVQVQFHVCTSLSKVGCQLEHETICINDGEIDWPVRRVEPPMHIHGSKERFVNEEFRPGKRTEARDASVNHNHWKIVYP